MTPTEARSRYPHWLAQKQALDREQHCLAVQSVSNQIHDTLIAANLEEGRSTVMTTSYYGGDVAEEVKRGLEEEGWMVSVVTDGTTMRGAPELVNRWTITALS